MHLSRLSMYLTRYFYSYATQVTTTVGQAWMMLDDYNIRVSFIVQRIH